MVVRSATADFLKAPVHKWFTLHASCHHHSTFLDGPLTLPRTTVQTPPPPWSLPSYAALLSKVYVPSLLPQYEAWEVSRKHPTDSLYLQEWRLGTTWGDTSSSGLLFTTGTQQSAWQHPGCSSGWTDWWIPRVYWPVTLTETLSSGFRKRPLCQNQGG